MTDSPEVQFTQRQQQFLTAEQTDQRRYDQWAVGRVAWFGLTALLSWVLFSTGSETGGYATLVVGAAGFVWLLKKHQLIRQSRDLNRYLAFVNEDELARLDRRYLRSDTGLTFADVGHAYAADLDLFGPHSLFRLLNRTHTHDGRQRLAHWLCQPALPGVIFQRQQAVADLKPRLDWRQQLDATAGLTERAGVSTENLRQWAAIPGVGLPGYFGVLRWVLPTVTGVVVLGWLAGLVPDWPVPVLLGLHGLVLSQTAKRAKEVSEQIYDIAGALSGFRQLCQLVETMSGVESARLRDIRQALHIDTVNGRDHTASAAIGRLARLTEQLNARRNPYFYLLVGVISLWDVQYLLALQRWQRQHGPALGGWLDALAELEALNSLAGFAFAHPDYATPDVAEGALLLVADSAVHPLLVPGRSVANSLTINGSGQTMLITGSNMSGKSTFLRTIGLNVVLALTGSVVAARRFACSPVQVFTSMRTQDSLEENTSSFYAELKRLQTLLKLSKPGHDAATDATRLPVLYFLDEILKGTNSADRHRGAEALIRQLHRTTASGFVSTHDLALGQLAGGQLDTSVDFVRNYHFQSEVVGGQLLFDYQLRDGVCRSFNATELMRRIGIEMDGAELEPATDNLTKTA